MFPRGFFFSSWLARGRIRAVSAARGHVFGHVLAVLRRIVKGSSVVGYTKLDALRLKGWLKAATVQLSEMLAREEAEQWIRDDPCARVKLPPKESPKLKKRLKRTLEQILEDLRRRKFYETADAVKATRTSNRKVQLLQVFLADLERDRGPVETWPNNPGVSGDDVLDLLRREGLLPEEGTGL